MAYLLFSQIKSVTELSGQICQICGDEIELTPEGEPFVACNECAFPVCRPCYEYERREGNQACPQCKTRYKRIKGEIIHGCSFLFCVKFSTLCVGANIPIFQVVLGLKEMRKRMTLMIWITSSTMGTLSLSAASKPVMLGVAYIQVDLVTPHRRSSTPLLLILRSHY